MNATNWTIGKGGQTTNIWWQILIILVYLIRLLLLHFFNSQFIWSWQKTIVWFFFRYHCLIVAVPHIISHVLRCSTCANCVNKYLSSFITVYFRTSSGSIITVYFRTSSRSIMTVYFRTSSGSIIRDLAWSPLKAPSRYPHSEPVHPAEI